MMEVRYTLTPQDFNQAMLAYRFTGRLAGLRVFLITVSPLFLFLLLLAVLLANPKNSAAQNTMPFALVLLFSVAMYWVSPFLAARKQFAGSPSAQFPQQLLISEAGLRFRTAHSNQAVDWQYFTRWFENKAVIVLMMSPTVFVVIPARAFLPEQLAWFRQLLSQRITPKS